jgi:serine phosphatase RsbU (regulator of sigma subunit)
MSSLWLIPNTGPQLDPIELSPSPDGQVIGRHEACSVRLPPDAEQVSRQHAKFDFDDSSGWNVTDLASRWGTTLNGVRLAPRQPTPIREGDLVRITPWTFMVSSTPRKRGLRPRDDMGQTYVRSVDEKNAQPLADSLLNLLLESAARIHACESEKELAESVIDAAMRGTGLTNAVMLKPLDGRAFEVVGSRVSKEAEGAPAQFSRSLINSASSGNVAEISAGSGGNFSQSLVQMNVSAAICVPMMLGASPAAYLYLDSRGSILQSIRPNGSAFCVALSRMASLALANLKRLEIEKRQAAMHAELNSAAAAQKHIMPRREQTLGTLRIIGESRPGQFVGGDFFDVIPLDGGKLAVVVGDVSGKGVTASVLMTAAQGFLHAAMQQHVDTGKAVTALNRYIAPRRPSSKFLTMWVGLIDPQKQTLCYVDAAHSYALLKHADGTIEQLDQGGGLPIGVDDEGNYDAVEVPFTTGDQLVIASDGIIEQPGTDSSSEQRVQFEVEGLRGVFADASQDIVKVLFERIITFAGTDQLADDATVLWVG